MVPFSDTNALDVSCWYFFNDLLTNMDAAIAKTGVKMNLYSSHDTTLCAFLTCLGNGKTPSGIPANPPFASLLLFELYDD